MRFTFTQNIRVSLDIRKKVQVANPPVDGKKIATLDDMIVGQCDKSVRAGNVYGRHAERCTQVILELLFTHPPGNVRQRCLAWRNHFIGEGAFGNVAGHFPGPGKSGDFSCDAPRAKIRRQLFGRDEAFRISGAQFFGQLLVTGVAQAVRSADISRVVQCDGLRVAFLDKGLEFVGTTDDVIGTVVLDQGRTDTQDGAFNAPFASIRENVVAI